MERLVGQRHFQCRTGLASGRSSPLDARDGEAPPEVDLGSTPMADTGDADALAAACISFFWRSAFSWSTVGANLFSPVGHGSL